ncbi:MAG: hypothetical protein C4B58_13785 [Deltaproteobacteria bacterium]|nr:MAG: hypothetical protein C4B58_13785 [Deltaproteobacteria bacterium]
MALTCEASVFVKIPCYFTGKLVLDTDRERIRQKVAPFLMEELGYRISDFQVDREILLEIDGQKVLCLADLVVHIDGRFLMVIRCGPGSVVTRESGTIAVARLLEPDYIIPWAVQASLIEAALLDVRGKRAIAYGWDVIPSRSKLLEMTSEWPPPQLPEKRIPVEHQILYSYDTHG